MKKLELQNVRSQATEDGFSEGISTTTDYRWWQGVYATGSCACCGIDIQSGATAFVSAKSENIYCDECVTYA